jgi:hypothetical protein
MVRAVHGRVRVALLVSMASLGLLVAHNLYWGARNQTEGDRRIRYRVLPRDISKASARTLTARGTQYAVYYWIDERVDAESVTVPPWLKSQRRTFEQAAGVTVIVSRHDLLVRAEEESQLRADSRNSMRYLVDHKTRTFADVYFVVEPGEKKYALAEGKADGARKKLYFLPLSRFSAVRAAMARRGSP